MSPPQLELARRRVAALKIGLASGGRGDIIGETAVGAAGWAGNLRMVEFLLQHGADPTVVTDDWGFDALTTIAGHRHPDIVEAIIEAGWPVEPRHLVQAGLKDRLAGVLDQETAPAPRARRFRTFRRRRRDAPARGRERARTPLQDLARPPIEAELDTSSPKRPSCSTGVPTSTRYRPTARPRSASPSGSATRPSRLSCANGAARRA